jgi:hypothetical protein
MIRDFRDALVSLRLTVALLALAMVLIFSATLEQVDLGVWAVQQKYFRSFMVYAQFGRMAVPMLPGGYTLGGLLLINLVAAHVRRFSFAWRKAGILATHVGLILLLAGELLSGIWQREYRLRLPVGATRTYAESFRDNELAVIDVTDAMFDEVVTIPEKMLEAKTRVQHPKLPFQIVPIAYYPNSALEMRSDDARPSLATTGLGERITAAPQPVTYKSGERNDPSAFVELIGSDGSLGRFLVSTLLNAPQRFTSGGRTWSISLRATRRYLPFAVTLENLSHDNYPGTTIPKNLASRIRLDSSNAGGREVVVSMNHPLRDAGLTIYQGGFENEGLTSVLQVVRNPARFIPYVACGFMALGLAAQFGIHLLGFIGRRREFRRPAGSTPSSSVISIPERECANPTRS